jgi:hypothetical protein
MLYIPYFTAGLNLGFPLAVWTGLVGNLLVAEWLFKEKKETIRVAGHRSGGLSCKYWHGFGAHGGGKPLLFVSNSTLPTKHCFHPPTNSSTIGRAYAQV